MTKEQLISTKPPGGKGEVKTAPSKKNLQASREQWPFIKEDYRLGHEWKAQGKPVPGPARVYPRKYIGGWE